MKTCSDCKKELDLELFPFDKSRNRHLSVCKVCTVKRTQAYRLKNKDKWNEYDRNRNKKCKQIIYEWKSLGCSKCGEKRPWVIDAHHLDPSQKELSIGNIGHGPNKLKEELKKCIPLCSNCHRDLHYHENK